jgi:DNA polymerase (family 10)
MTDKKLIKILKNIAYLLEIKGENPFKSRAYSNAARILDEENIDIAGRVSDGTLGEIKGIGDALQKKIPEYFETGHIDYYDRLIEEIPESIIEITKISTIGPKKARFLFEKMEISDLDALEKACLNNEISGLKGFSAKSQEIILNSIQHKKAAKGKFLFDIISADAEVLKNSLYATGFIDTLEITGDLRRFAETPKSIEFVLVPNAKENFLKTLEKDYNIKAGNKQVSFISKNNIPVKLYFAGSNDFGSVLHQKTGNTDYLDGLEEYRKSKLGIGVSAFPNEAELFDTFELQYIPPELRERKEIIGIAVAGNIPELIDYSDMKGMLHVHTNWSDGKNTIEEMAIRAKELNFEYIAITDHSQSASYANGLTIDRIKAQHEEIDRLNEAGLGINILKGIESDILSDGSLDYPDSVLDSFDLVVASVHSHFNMTKDDMTKRIIYALMSPYVHILGHPTGRLLLAREAYALDIEAIIDFATANKKIIEINCNPYRLDLSWRNVIYAKKWGLKIAINPDSHNINTLSDVEIGVKVARKGGLKAKDVVNTLPFDDFLMFLDIK